MAVKVNVPTKQQDTSMGRRLFAMAAPIAGGMMGGPAGAAAGSILGSKMSGGSIQEALQNGLMTGAQQGLTRSPAEKPEISVENLNASQGLQQPGIGDSAFGRRINMKSQDPAMAINEGLGVLSELPPDHPFRKQYTEPLVRAQLKLGGR